MENRSQLTKPWVVRATHQAVEVAWQRRESSTLWALQLERSGDSWSTEYRGYGSSTTLAGLEPASHYRVRLAELRNDGSARPQTPIYVATTGTPKTLEDLFHAIENGRDAAVEHILGHEVLDIDCMNTFGLNPLMMAAELGHVKIVQLLLDHKADPCATGLKGRTALMLAAHQGHLDIVNKLLGAGCQWDDRDSLGETALHLAVAGDQQAVVEQALRSGGASVDVREATRGWTPLAKAVVLGRSLGIAELLVTLGRADVNATDHNGQTPLMLAALTDNLEVTRLLVTHGADVHRVNRVGETALSIASSRDNKEVANFLEEHIRKNNKEPGELGAPIRQPTNQR